MSLHPSLKRKEVQCPLSWDPGSVKALRWGRIMQTMLGGVHDLVRFEHSVFCDMEARGCHGEISILQLGVHPQGLRETSPRGWSGSQSTNPPWKRVCLDFRETFHNKCFRVNAVHPLRVLCIPFHWPLLFSLLNLTSVQMSERSAPKQNIRGCTGRQPSLTPNALI